MANHDDDEFDSDTHDAASKVGEAVGNSVDQNGDFSLFGKKIPLGKTWGPIAGVFSQYLQDQITDKLGKGAFNTIIENSDKLGLQKHTAFAWARVIEYIFRIGPQMLDIAGELKSNVQNRYTEIDSVSRSLDVYMAANHNMSVGKQPFLLDDNPMIANVRNHMMEKGKNGLWKVFGQFVGKAPSLLVSMWSSKIFEIENTHRLEEILTQIPEQNRGKIQAHIDSLKAMSVQTGDGKSTPGTQIQEIMDKFERYKEEKGSAANEVDFFVKNVGLSEVTGLLTNVGGWADMAKMMARPKSVADLSMNKALLEKVSMFGPELGKWVSSKLVNKVAGHTEDFTLFKLITIAEQAKSGDLPRHHELKGIIENAFRSHMKECGHKQPIKGEKIEMISEKLAEAITKGGLNAYALIDLVGKNKLIHFKDGAYHFASREETDQLILTEEKKYLPRVNLKQYYKEAPFKKEDIKCVYDKLDDDLKALFIACVPVNVLEDVGVKPKEIDHVMKRMEGKFEGMAAEVFERVSKMDNEELKELGVSSKNADQMRSLAEEFVESQRFSDQEVAQFLRDNKNKIQVVLRNITMGEKGVNAISELTGVKEARSEGEEHSNEGLRNLSNAVDEEDRHSRPGRHKRGVSTEDRIRDIKARGERKHHAHSRSRDSGDDSPGIGD